MLSRIALPYTENAAAYFAALADLPWPAWLDSGGRGRYDIITAAPAVTLQTGNEHTLIMRGDSRTLSTDDPFALLRHELGNPLEVVEGIKFAGGALGYWSYDILRKLYDLPDMAADTGQLPLMAVGIYDWALQIDHQQRCAELLSWQRYPQTAALLQQIQSRLQQPSLPQSRSFHVQGRIASNFSKASYARAFSTVQEYLHAGDCYQINLAQRFTARASGDAFAAYGMLRELSPSPHAAFLNLPFAQILCASPERFLQVEQGKVETKPIKGTRPRLVEHEQNARQVADLQSNSKDRAENLMIVDLLRNDLGKHCVPGSVRVPHLFEVESYATVHHLVSTITGELAPGHDALALLRDCFPGGSITGAPKQRAMEIIEELEPNRRGIYCGVIGYVGFDGNMDTNIAIRTLVYAEGEICCWAGGGIVADSQLDAEYQETLDKAAAMLEVLRRFGAQEFVPE